LDASEGNAEDRRQKRRHTEQNQRCPERAGGEHGIVGYLVVQALANPAAFMSLLGKVLPMTIGDTGKDVETRMVVENRIVWPEDKDRNIIRPSWWGDDGFKKA
jgi:hypothetical protein